jgi:hypothetical protein
MDPSNMQSSGVEPASTPGGDKVCTWGQLQYGGCYESNGRLGLHPSGGKLIPIGAWILRVVYGVKETRRITGTILLLF